MPHIQQLESHVADLIAAGEVVERPASVVKELVENAVDAGSSAVVVEIRRGGMGMIRVTDNGCGIAPEELPTAFLRHATSKLRTEEDLGKIGTLGFRGEALAAISAVSRVDILTRQTGTTEGAALHLEGGVPGAVEPAGAPEGTTITVRDLFYNTPARLKFMRKDSAETAAVNGLMQHLALSHPDISFKFIKDGVEALLTPGDGKLDSAVYAALGRDFARGLVPVSGSGGDITVSGFVTAPLMGRGSRSMQVFFVNGRFIKSQLLTAALEEGYRNQIMKGKFPGCVLSVTLPVTAVDVNVHPAKTQVKFAREHDVFDAVYHTVLDALGKPGAPAAAPAQETRLPAASRQDFFQTMEISVMLALLEIVDNPRQDVPLISVLRSPLFGLTADDLATVRTCDREHDFYTAVTLAAETRADCRDFLDVLARYRALSIELPLSEFLWHIVDDRAVMALTSAMPDGELRRRNVLLLLDLAQQFEQTGARGLHRFLLWMQRQETEGVEPAAPGGESRSVRILSIHKSKGLEFPVVFVSALGRQFNRQDSRGRMVVHSDYGACSCTRRSVWGRSARIWSTAWNIPRSRGRRSQRSC